MILNFKEIPQANLGSGMQDTFELFARDFLSYLGYRIVQDPDRGADGKKDLIVDEIVKGITKEYTIRWLVSCKHYAHHGGAVKDSDEINITERLKQHGCQGFMGIYSTLAATSLSGVLSGIDNYEVFDHEKIESLLLQRPEGYRLAERYFPKSFKDFLRESPVVSKIFQEEPGLYCDHCGANLLEAGRTGVFVLLSELNQENNLTEEKYKDMYFACKGDCDNKLKDDFRAQGLKDAGWEDIDELCNPGIWIAKFMAFLNGIQTDHDLSPEAFKKMKKLFINTYTFVARQQTSKEEERISQLISYGLF